MNTLKEVVIALQTEARKHKCSFISSGTTKNGVDLWAAYYDWGGRRSDLLTLEQHKKRLIKYGSDYLISK